MGITRKVTGILERLWEWMTELLQLFYSVEFNWSYQLKRGTSVCYIANYHP